MQNPIVEELVVKAKEQRFTDPTSQPTASHRLASTLFTFSNFHILLFALSSCAALFFLCQVVNYLPPTGDNVYPESSGIAVSQRWAHHGPLYADYRQIPYFMTPFPPLWYGILAAASRIGHFNLDALLLFGRVLSLTCLFAAMLLGYRWNRRLGLSPKLALLTPAFFVSLPILIPWAVTARPDLLALLFAFVAIYCIGLGARLASVPLGALAAALAFLAKHNTVAASVAIVFWLVWVRRWKHAAVFCAVWGIVAGTVLLSVNISSHGLLVLNISGAKFGLFALTYARDILNRLISREGQGFAVLLFAFGTFGFVESWRKHTDIRIQLVSVYLVVSLALGFVGSAAAGAAVNHYLESAFAMALLTPIGVSRLATVWDRESPFAPFVIITVLALVLPSLDTQRWNAVHNKAEDLRGVLSWIKDKDVFTDDSYIAARLPHVQVLDLPSLTNTERRGGKEAWSSSTLVAAATAKRYEFAILRSQLNSTYDANALYPRSPRLDNALEAALIRNYELCFAWNTPHGEGPLYVYSSLSNDVGRSNTGCRTAEAAYRAAQAHW